jgi:transcriptional regulator with PAS, ATPase and Fis domain
MSADPFEAIIGHSRVAQAIRSFGRRAAAVEAPVLLLGESGTGKGVLARAIHQASARSARPFVGVNCAAIPDSLFESEFFGHVRGAFTGAQFTHKGLFEQAHSGTLFLDEIGELPLPAQAKLLTALEDRAVRRVGAERSSPVDVRIIAATACDLPAHVNARTFRTDLYHRLSILCIELPPLRSRADDIPAIATHLLQSIAARYHIDHACPLPEETTAMLREHSWPGNVRELANAIERAVLLKQDEAITPASVGIMTAATSHASRHGFMPATVRYSFIGTTEQEAAHIKEALTLCRGNKTRAAAMLGMSRNTLLNKLRLIECE